MRRPHFAIWMLIAASAFAGANAPVADSDRQQEVRRNGEHVMPFSLDRTQHVFDKTADGGVQRVLIRGQATDQVARIRMHLRSIAQSFAARDFAAPAQIHGAGMAGLAELRRAAPHDLSVTYRDVEGGGEIDYVGRTPAVVAAIHRWFDAQLADHGRDATGHAPDAH